MTNIFFLGTVLVGTVIASAVVLGLLIENKKQ